MNIEGTSVYVGPNVHAKEPLIRLTIDVKPSYAERLAELGGSVIEQLLAVLPGWAAPGARDADWLAETRAAGRFDLGDLLARLALELQRAAGQRGNLAWAEATDDRDVLAIFYSFDSEDIGLEAGEVACDLLAAIANAEEEAAPDLEEDVDRFLRYADKRTLGPSAMELVRAAEARDIPWYRLNDASLIQVGQGKYQQRIEAALSSKTSHIAVEIASDKNMCNQLLSDLGLPVPKQPGDRVTFTRTAQQAATNFRQQQIADFVALGVIEHLEVVDVDEQQGGLTSTMVARVQNLSHPVDQQATVGQGGERVIKGQLVDLGFVFLAL